MEQCEIENIIKFITESEMITLQQLRQGVDGTVGKNYFGSLISLKITGLKEGRPKNVNVLMKIPPKIDLLRIYSPLTTMYEREIYFYEKIQSKFREIDGTFTTAKCYYTRSDVLKEVIVLKDLRCEGYANFEGMFLNFECAVKSVECIAHFHALSIALEKKFPKDFEEFNKICWNLLNYENAYYIESLDKAIDDTVSLIGGDVGKFYEHLKRNFVIDLNKNFDNVKIKTMCHGDVWKNNIVFKCRNGKPSSCCLLDYQFIHVGAAARDLLYLIITSTDSILRQRKFHSLIETYHKQLNQFLQKYGIDKENSFTFENLKSDLKSVAPGCLVLATHAFQNWLDISESTREIFEKPATGEEEKIKNKIRFVEIMTNLVTDFKSFGLID